MNAIKKAFGQILRLNMAIKKNTEEDNIQEISDTESTASKKPEYHICSSFELTDFRLLPQNLLASYITTHKRPYALSLVDLEVPNVWIFFLIYLT